jgi:predicted Fe-Mo cluster-binding NifX family protein
MGHYPTAEQTSKYIKKHFGTVNRFADIAKLDQATVRNTLKRVPGKPVRDLLELAEKTKAEQPDAVASYEIAPADVTALKKHVDTAHGGNLSEFARQHGLDVITADQVARGKRKRKTGPVVAAMRAAKVSGY